MINLPATHAEYNPPSSPSYEPIHGEILSEPATEPPLNEMSLVFYDFPWNIDIALPAGSVITINHVLMGLYNCLQQFLMPDEWDSLEGTNAKKNVHRARCGRLSRGPARFTIAPETVALKRVDLLADKVVFMGMKADDTTEKWIVRLGFLSDREPARLRR